MSKKNKSSSKAKAASQHSALDIIEGGIHLIRRAPFAAYVAYLVGTLPFLLALLYFWADLSKAADAWRRAPSLTLLLCISFIWMKCWQCVFCRYLRRGVGEQLAPFQGYRQAWRLLIDQLRLQITVLLLMPIAAAITLPFGWWYAFGQNCSVLCDGSVREEGDADPVKVAWKQAKLWPRQNHAMLWLVCPMLVLVPAVLVVVIAPLLSMFSSEFSTLFLMILGTLFAALILLLSPLQLIIGLNIATALAFLPFLVKMLFGVQSVFTLSTGSLFSTTFLVVVCSLTYLLLDPIVKGCYVLRCFYGASITSGADLRVRIQEQRQKRQLLSPVLTALVLIGCLLVPGTGHAEPPPTQELDQAVSDVLERREFAWRSPREEPAEAQDGFLKEIFGGMTEMIQDSSEYVIDKIGIVFETAIKKLDQFFSPTINPPNINAPPAPDIDWNSVMMGILFLSLIVIALIIGFFILRTWQNRRLLQSPGKDTPQIVTEPDLEDEEISPDALPEDEWMIKARELLAQGNTRLALRAMFLSLLAYLGEKQLIQINIGKSNRDYRRELERRSHALPEVREAFIDNIRTYERTWYGDHAADLLHIETFESNLQRIKEDVDEQ